MSDSSNTDANYFAEYMWMENEEEFDKEVLQLLHKEDRMEPLFEALVEAEVSRKESSIWTEKSSAAAAVCKHLNGIKFGGKKNEVKIDKDKSSEKQQQITRKRSKEEIVKSSKLNPLAAEFVPGASAKQFLQVTPTNSPSV